jgi:5-methylcytosine-specific restriction endonuclease McrA
MGGYERVGIFEIDVVFDFIVKNNISKKRINFEGFPVRTESLRYKVFMNKGVICKTCGLEGKFFALEKTSGSMCNFYHFNLYGFDKNGKESLMTKDHIQASSKGGTNSLENLQPMCMTCNSKKGNS